MQNNDRKPEIRFSGFEAGWKKKCFGDEFDILSNNTLSRDFLNYDQGIAKNVHYGDVLIKFNEYLDASKEVLPYIEDKKVIDKFQNSFLRDGDIVIADTAEDETVGKCTEIGQISDLPIIAGLHTMPCRPKAKYAPMYLGYYLNANAYHRELLPLMQGVKVTSISRSGVKDTDIIVSEEYDEQKKIGQFLFTLDEKIKFEQDKLDRLIILKKSMLEKMFPQGNSKVPEIRFRKYTDEWEQRKLGDVAELTSSKRIHAEDYVDSGIPFYRGKEISELRVQKPVSEVLYITEEKYEEITKIYGSPKKNDLLITAVGTLGNTWIVDKLPFYFKDGNLIWFKNIKCNSRYLDYALGTSEGQKKIMESAIGSNQKALTMVKLNELKFMFPNEAEQEQIATYFTNLDNLITFHQRKVDKLKNIKSSCMDKMFV